MFFSVPMISFFSTVIAALIGAMLAPYFSNIINFKNKNREKMLNILEKKYILLNNISNYLFDNQMYVIQRLYNLRYNDLNMDLDLKDLDSSDFREILFNLEYHLKCPNLMIEKFKAISLDIKKCIYQSLKQLTQELDQIRRIVNFMIML